MSNQITINLVAIENIRTGNITYGYTVSDDYGNSYNDSLYDSKQECPDDDLVFLADVIENFNTDYVRDLFDYIQEAEIGIMIGKTYYDWDEIKSLFE